MQTVLCWTNVNTLTLDAAINLRLRLFIISQIFSSQFTYGNSFYVSSRNDVVDPGTQVGTFLDVAGCR